MFKDVGKELKSRAELFAIKETAKYAFIGGGLTLAVLLLAGVDDLFWALVAAAVCGFFGYLGARDKVLLLYAYGELVDRVISIERKVSGSCDEGTEKTKEKQKVKATPVDSSKWVPKVSRNSDGSWDCPFCEHHNPAGADWCEECNIAANFE